MVLEFIKLPDNVINRFLPAAAIQLSDIVNQNKRPPCYQFGLSVLSNFLSQIMRFYVAMLLA